MRCVFIVGTLWLLASAGTPAQTIQTPAAAASEAWSIGTRPTMSLADGQVERVDKMHSEVVIKHGELPNLGMEAMTMGFAVADNRMLDRLKAGDKVRFNAEIKNGEATVSYIESVR